MKKDGVPARLKANRLGKPLAVCRARAQQCRRQQRGRILEVKLHRDNSVRFGALSTSLVRAYAGINNAPGNWLRRSGITVRLRIESLEGPNLRWRQMNEVAHDDESDIFRENVAFDLLLDGWETRKSRRGR